MNVSLIPITNYSTAINAVLPQPPQPPRTVAFTTPSNYAHRLSLLLHRRSWTPLWCPTVVVEPTSATRAALLYHIKRLQDYSAVAFTSRAGISAFSSILPSSPPLPSSVEEFIIAALGNDGELLSPEFVSKLCSDTGRVKIIIPARATPSGLVESLGEGLGRKILCPVPLVSGLEEPPVVPDFLRELGSMGWVAVRVNAYETRWAGALCTQRLLDTDHIDGLVFTSTAEVEGLLNSLMEYGLSWDSMRKKWPGLVVAAHGPVTASGAERLGVRVDVVSSKFSSFEGVIEALDYIWGDKCQK